MSSSRSLRVVLLGLALAPCGLAAAETCPVLDLHVAEGPLLPPAFTTTDDVALPHPRLPDDAVELYRLGDPSGADAATVRLFVDPGAVASEVVLTSDLGCTVPPGFDETGTILRELHVATDGSAGGDGSPGDPFDTLWRAAGVAVPGDRIVIHQGSYPGSNFITGLQGTAANPIVITGAPDEPPPVLGSTSVIEAIHLTDPAYVVLQDLVIEGPTGNGINIDDGGDYSTPAHHVVVQRVAIRDIGTGGNQDCLKLSGLDDFVVRQVDIRDCGAGGSGVDMVGCHRGRIEDSTFRDVGSSGIQAKGGSSEVVIKGNLLVDAGLRAVNLGGSTGLAFFRPPGANYEARDLQVLANVFVGSTAPIAYVGCDACLVANNTLYLPQNWVMRILQETTEPGFIPCRDGRFVNNIVVFDSADLSTFVNVGPDTLPQTFSFANNLWFSRDDPAFTGPSLPTPEVDPVIQLDPLLADPRGEDFHVPPSSPAFRAGAAVPETACDRDRQCYRLSPTVGADEPFPP